MQNHRQYTPNLQISSQSNKKRQDEKNRRKKVCLEEFPFALCGYVFFGADCTFSCMVPKQLFPCCKSFEIGIWELLFYNSCQKMMCLFSTFLFFHKINTSCNRSRKKKLKDSLTGPSLPVQQAAVVSIDKHQHTKAKVQTNKKDSRGLYNAFDETKQ